MIIERRGDWRGGIKDWEAPPSEASNDGSLPLRDGDPVVLRSILASSWLLLLFSSISGGATGERSDGCVREGRSEAGRASKKMSAPGWSVLTSAPLPRDER